MIESIKALYNNGLSERKIASKLNISRAFVRTTLLNLKCEKAQIIDLYNRFRSVKKVAEYLSISPFIIKNYLNDKLKEKIYIDKEKIIKLFSLKYNEKQIIKKLDLPEDNLYIKTYLRFLKNIKLNKDCWEWQKAVDKNGYGKFRACGEIYAHRFVWKIEFGEIPNGFVVCHKCDNVKCSNPNHLFLGTQKENLKDAEKKGRLKRIGQDNPMAKLSNLNIVDLVEKFKSGETIEDLSKEYKITKSYVSNILSGKSRNKIPIINRKKRKSSNNKTNKMDFNDFVNFDILSKESIETIKYFEKNLFNEENVNFIVKYYNFGYNKITKARLRFLSKIHIDNCWYWKDTCGDNVYGSFHFGNTSFSAHRVAWQIANKRLIPKNMIVCHKCDNKSCVRPDHLFLGTHSDNVQDAVNKGLIKSGDESPNTKIKTKDKEEIIKLYLNDKTQGFIADLYNVSCPTIRKILDEYDIEKKIFSNSKMTEELAKKILNRFNTENITQAELAREYKLNKCVIHELVRRKSWKFLK